MAVYVYFFHLITIPSSLIGFCRSMSEKQDLAQTIMKDWRFETADTPPCRSELFAYSWLRDRIRDPDTHRIAAQPSCTLSTGDRRC